MRPLESEFLVLNNLSWTTYSNGVRVKDTLPVFSIPIEATSPDCLTAKKQDTSISQKTEEGKWLKGRDWNIFSTLNHPKALQKKVQFCSTNKKEAVIKIRM